MAFIILHWLLTIQHALFFFWEDLDAFCVVTCKLNYCPILFACMVFTFIVCLWLYTMYFVGAYKSWTIMKWFCILLFPWTLDSGPCWCRLLTFVNANGSTRIKLSMRGSHFYWWILQCTSYWIHFMSFTILISFLFKLQKQNAKSKCEK